MKKIIFIPLFILFSFISKGQSNLFVPPLPEMSYVSVVDKSKFLGDRWSYMESGKTSSPVIIALHGYGGSSADWRYQLFDLSDTYRVIAWNAPGYMLSDELKTNYPNRGNASLASALWPGALPLRFLFCNILLSLIIT